MTELHLLQESIRWGLYAKRNGLPWTYDNSHKRRVPMDIIHKRASIPYDIIHKRASVNNGLNRLRTKSFFDNDYGNLDDRNGA